TTCWTRGIIRALSREPLCSMNPHRLGSGVQLVADVSRAPRRLLLAVGRPIVLARRRIMKNHSRMFFCLLVIVWAGASRAQYTTASLGGTVADPAGSAVPQANVKVENMDTGLAQTSTTGVNGQFVFPTLPVGRYRLTIEKPGFTTYV